MVQDHLGRQLRSTYTELQDKPAYLGDPALPLAFDDPLYRLAARERVRDRGVTAVRSALQDLLFAAHLRQAGWETLSRPRPTMQANKRR
jgi:hypothetical protein